MASAINRTTLEYRRSINTPDFPSSEWIINPNLSAVIDIPKRYWKITGNSVGVMNQSERNAVDTALAESSLDGQTAQVDAGILKAIVKTFAQITNQLSTEAGLPTRSAAEIRAMIRNNL